MNWLIKLLGGVTMQEHLDYVQQSQRDISSLALKLHEARKNDHRDPETGRFIKAGD